MKSNIIRFFVLVNQNCFIMLNKYSFFVVICLLILSCTKEDTTTTTDCTGTIPTYSSDIAAIFNASCATAGCHSGSFPADGLDLSSFATAKNASLNGKVLASMKHSSGTVAMPLGGTKLADAVISKVECWINNGAPE
jgi:hypothetical protein